jgi:hypothetical protein
VGGLHRPPPSGAPGPLRSPPGSPRGPPATQALALHRHRHRAPLDWPGHHRSDLRDQRLLLRGRAGPSGTHAPRTLGHRRASSRVPRRRSRRGRVRRLVPIPLAAALGAAPLGLDRLRGLCLLPRAASARFRRDRRRPRASLRHPQAPRQPPHGHREASLDGYPWVPRAALGAHRSRRRPRRHGLFARVPSPRDPVAVGLPARARSPRGSPRHEPGPGVQRTARVRRVARGQGFPHRRGALPVRRRAPRGPLADHLERAGPALLPLGDPCRDP